MKKLLLFGTAVVFSAGTLFAQQASVTKQESKPQAAHAAKDTHGKTVSNVAEQTQSGTEKGKEVSDAANDKNKGKHKGQHRAHHPSSHHKGAKK